MANRTYISLDATKSWLQELGYSRWNLYELGDGRESAIMEHKGDNIDESLARLDSVVRGTSQFNERAKYKILVFKNDNPNSTKYEKYFSLNGYTDAPTKEEKTQPLAGFGGLNSEMFSFLTQIGEVKGQSQAKEAFISYREEQLIRRETLMEVREKDLEEKFKQREKELKSEIEGLKKKYEDNVDAAKSGFSMALIEGIKTFTGMNPGGGSNNAIGSLESGLTDVQKRVLALAKDRGWKDEQWQDVGNMVSSIPADMFHAYFLALCAFYKQAGTDAEKVRFLTNQIPQIAIP